MEKEEWRDVVGYEGLYEVSSYGRVKRVARKSVEKGSIYEKRIMEYKEKLFIPQIHPCGYENVSLIKNRKTSTKKVHRLVAEAFIPNPENKKEVNHIDANKTNNNVSNLEWLTHDENIQHARQLKRFLFRKGELSPTSKLTNTQVLKIRELRLNGETLKKLANKYNVSIGLIYQICKRKAWKHI